MERSRVRSVVIGALGFMAGGLAVGVTLGATAGAASGRFWKESAPPVQAPAKPASPEAPLESLPSLRGLVKTVKPSVVFIFTTKNVRMNPHSGMPFDLGPFGFRFGP